VPGWGDVLGEFDRSARQHNGQPQNDNIRRRYFADLAKLTGRSTILYATAWLSKPGIGDQSINLQDMQGMMEACRDLPGPGLDIILHSPGGSAEAASSIVTYLRQKYDDIRVFVPLAAMSAATMWALSANRIVMGKHSQLGPIDPQFMFPQQNGAMLAVPARTILDQFEQAKKEIAANPACLGAWAPMIPQYGPGLLQMCESTNALSRGLVSDWLKAYMFANLRDPEKKAEEAARFFADFTQHKSHAVGIFRDVARSKDVVIDDLETDPNLQDALLSVFHATMLTFNFSSCIKLIENNMGRGFYVQAQQVLLQGLMPQAPQPQGAPPAAPPAQPAP
jgi:hypothetical protein